jgi:hypothetical protein
MSLFRKNTIFHVEESLPDPEELKLRFRRRILIFSLLGFLLVLGTPVARDLRPNLNARAEARVFAERMLEARTLAAISRMPVSLEIAPDKQGWRRAFHAQGENCAAEAPGPSLSFSTEGEFWKVQAQQENGSAVSGHTLCWHPVRGLLLDSVPLGDGKLLVSLSTSEGGAAVRELASVLVTQGGAEFQTISY